MNKMKCSLLVIGGGGSGLTAAARAADRGLADVLVLEKTDTVGGASVLAKEISAVDTRRQNEFGASANLDNYFNEAMTLNGWSGNPRVVRTVLANSGHYMEWLESKGVLCDTNQSDDKYFDTLEGKGQVGRAITDAMAGECERLGVKIMLGTRATELIFDGGGGVSGVKAVGVDEYEIEAGAVVIACGSFSANMDMLKKYLPKYFDDGNSVDFEVLGGEALCRFADGDGIKMLEGSRMLPDYHLEIDMSGPTHSANEATNYAIKLPEMVWVNARGCRYNAEGAGAEAYRLLVEQPGGYCHAIFDSATVDYIIDEHLPSVKRRLSHDLKYRRLAKLKDILAAEVEEGTAFMADSIAELARLIDVDEAVLTAEIEGYNVFCEAGEDVKYYKNPDCLRPVKTAPFYALKGRTSYRCTFGGISVDEHMRVVLKGGGVVGGLYAVGDNAAGWSSEYGRSPDAGLMWAVNTGYVAADEIYAATTSDY